MQAVLVHLSNHLLSGLRNRERLTFVEKATVMVSEATMENVPEGWCIHNIQDMTYVVICTVTFG